MKKINVLIAGLVILLSLGLTAFTESEQHALNRGDGGGAPARPDYVNIGDTGGAPADNKGDTGGAPADNKGDGGGVSQL
ncbi:Phr family secreted Rap phosphatase inhibitor [Bacillus cereus]|uniref:Phr family secreted Rap phosphatase inhibitor n=2 Tax=Bacillus cereus TaxID=1396 RepID=UPI000BF803A6|nr:Phr family secreted Rap phosphatase inhibitor [Bacillus cereus]MDA1965780.1 Phr family secreted Rap phosphatase inhibitor [Bacillus cereus]PEW68798.1 Phr family secreted Rap phosphatase inhibitor [Bacillus cereus]HDR7758814.1 Phr family secreted Rap phosphatase inhibitor [Bacillus cereus]